VAGGGAGDRASCLGEHGRGGVRGRLECRQRPGRECVCGAGDRAFCMYVCVFSSGVKKKKVM
jgi:hypothetical protein